jgi:hypothetical protein
MHVKTPGNNFAELFKEMPGVTSVVFLLTRLKNEDVRAEVIRSVQDPRLRSKEPFAAICVDHFRLEQSEQELFSKYTAEPVDSYVNGVGIGHILNPRVYEKLLAGTTNDFFDALAEVNGDVILTNYDEEDDEWHWHVKDNSQPFKTDVTLTKLAETSQAA